MFTKVIIDEIIRVCNICRFGVLRTTKTVFNKLLAIKEG
ncbi:hypothetical protein PARC_p0053 (plasmid) [Pseudoalteromonas arctica A 37-1-2]|uniref:Uncharacterized protein n=1 Tax=Pseudoalteromonas arctica A 37-1-2 TaxID=1117313 RepID=A0A290SAD8_9GAMM|nr:hypothetical protein PARC_p0053 [Pseudoalteromonas arctica A 37-1-2]